MYQKIQILYKDFWILYTGIDFSHLDILIEQQFK